MQASPGAVGSCALILNDQPSAENTSSAKKTPLNRQLVFESRIESAVVCDTLRRHATSAHGSPA